MEIKYYRCGKGVIATCGTMDMEEITEDEYNSEIATISEKLAIAEEAYERHRPLTESEALSMILKQKINTLDVDDQTALRMMEFYPAWNGLIGQTCDKAGFRFTYGGKLYKTIPTNHTFQADWVPGVGTESLYTRIDETHDGTKYDPIPYEGNMALVSGKYYSQDGVTYLCNRDTVNPVYNPLRELVGIYVEQKGE